MTTGPFGTGAFGTVPFSTTPFYNTSTLIDAVLRATNHANPSTETEKRALILSFLNNRYSRITTSRHWDWLNGSIDFELKKPYSTGTVALTQGENTATGTGTAWSANVIPNNKIVIGDYVHLITAVNSTTTLTIEGAYAGSTASGLGYKIIKPIYRMPDDCEHVKSITIDKYDKLVPVGIQELRRLQHGQSGVPGVPKVYTELFRRPADGVRNIEIWPAPDDNLNAHIDYNIMVMALTDSTDNYPLIPDKHRAVLFYGALAEFQMFLMDPSAAAVAEQAYARMERQLQSDMQITDSKIVIGQKRDYRFRKRRRHLRTFMSRAQFSIDENY